MRPSLCLVALAACAPFDPTVAPPSPLPEDWEEVEGDEGGQRFAVGLQFTQDPLVPDTDVTFTVRGAAPGDLVRFLYSTTGTGAGPCIAQLGGLCLGLRTPITEIDQDTANASGVAEVTVHLPLATPQIYVFTQAVVDRGAGSVATNTITAPVLAGALDADADGFCGGSTCADPATLPGDCHDGDAAVHPGNQQFRLAPFTDPTGADSWDWNCDGVEEQMRTTLWTCQHNGGLPTCPFTAGFTQGVPACGDSGFWGTFCQEIPLVQLCTSGSGQTLDQLCR